MMDQLYLNGLVTGINIGILVLSVILLCKNRLLDNAQLNQKSLLTSMILIGMFFTMILADILSAVLHIFPLLDNPFATSIKTGIYTAIIGGFVLEAIALQNKPIRYKVVAIIIWTPSLVQLLLSVFAVSHPEVCKVATFVVYAYMYILYLGAHIELYRWDVCMKQLYSDIDFQESDNEEVPAWVEKMDNLMREQRLYTQPNLDIQSLAQEVGVNKTYISRYLNQVRHLNFYDYVNAYRLEASTDLLRKSSDSIEQIALQCGYSNMSTFGRLFKRKYHMSPTAYQKNPLKP